MKALILSCAEVQLSLYNLETYLPKTVCNTLLKTDLYDFFRIEFEHNVYKIPMYYLYLIIITCYLNE